MAAKGTPSDFPPHCRRWPPEGLPSYLTPTVGGSAIAAAWSEYIWNAEESTTASLHGNEFPYCEERCLSTRYRRDTGSLLSPLTRRPPPGKGATSARIRSRR